MKIFTMLVAALILATGLSACGSNEQDAAARAEAARVKAYCASLKTAAPDIRAFDVKDPDYKKMQRYFDMMQGLAAKSPTSVIHEWNVVNFDFSEIEKAAKAANLKFSAIPKLLKNKVPKDSKPQEFAALTDAFSYLTSVNLATALSTIENNARKVCKVDLTASKA